MGLTHLTELAGFIAILILDFKGDFFDIPARLGRDRWSLYSPEDGFRVGIAPPINCPNHMAWINQVTRILAAHLDLKFSEGAIAKALRISLKLLNDSLSTPLAFASLLLLEQLLHVLPGKLLATKEEWLRSAQQRIEQLRRISGTLFEAEHGFDVARHLNGRCAVVDCTMLSSIQAQILANLLALQLLFPRVTERRVSLRPDFAYIVDEADPLASYKASIVYPEGYSPLAQLMKQGREFGIMVVLGMSFLGQCSRFISANATYHFILNQCDPESTAVAAQTLLEPHSRTIVSQLKRGHCLFKEAMGPVPYGMLLKADHVPASAMPRPKDVDHHSFTPARGIEEIPGLQDRINELSKEFQKTVLRQRQTAGAGSALTRNEREFLDHMTLHERKCEPIHKIFARMGNPSPATQKSIISKLVKKGLLEATQIRTSKSPVRIGYPTELAWTFFNKQPQLKPLRGSLKHKMVSRWTRLYDLQNGAEESICEFQVPGAKGVRDVGSTFHGELHCREIVIDCFTNVGHHARACFLDVQAVKTLTYVTLLRSDGDRIRKALNSDPDLAPFLDRIHFMQVDEILKSLFPREV